MRLNSTLTAALLAVGALAGCTGAPPSAPPVTASPSYSCTPEAGGTPLPCGPIEHEQAQQRDALYAEAERVYRKYWNELDRLTLIDDPPFSEELTATTGDPFRTALQQVLAPGVHSERADGEALLVRLNRLPGLSKSGSSVALLACIDASRARYVINPGDAPKAGGIYEQRAYLGYSEGPLKIIDSEIRDVESCNG